MRALVWIAGLLTAGPVAAAPPKPSAEAAFATRVLPALKAKCFACHGEDAEKVKGGLDLTTREKLLAGGDSGEPGFVPGKAAESAIYRAILRTDKAVAAMPPKENDKLTAEQAAAVRDWIDGGAPWPSAERIAELVAAEQTAGVRVKTSGELSADWTNRTYKPEDLWAYQPLRKASAGATVDGFISAKLRAAKLTPAPAADRRTLARRVTFDLTGLPPTPEEIDAFVTDTSPTAYEKLIDRLLASPHYGEQMARHWLDLTRYADSAGFANDYDRGNAWRYRDYVVRSFNADKPYDRFVTEQLAGDEVAPADPEALVAVGFLRMGAWELTGMEVAKVARQRFLDDVTDTAGQVFLGHMLQCARCHDHKFDPVPTRDYYRIQAAFATTQLAERPAAFLPNENVREFYERKYLVARQERLEAELKRILEAEAAARKQWAAANPDKKGEKPPRHEFLSPADLGLERIARKGLERLKWEFDRYEPVALSVYSGRTPDVKAIYAPFRVPKNPAAGTLEVSHILGGGDPFSPKDEVSPGVVSAAGDAAIPNETEGRRAALAKWVVDPKNPLTARVMANRVWQWTMGTPLAGNPNNFGTTGKKPTHPELLDWLAAEFVANGWSVKKLQKTILLSEAYRRSSRHPDPKAGGDLYAAFRPRRLAAEELRDALLAVSGELTRTVGGVPVRPELNPDVAFQPRQVMGTFAPAWEPSPKPEQRHRRTLYALKLRGVRDPLLDVFNAPVADSPCEARDVSTTAPQAFALFNAEATRARALAFATRLVAVTKTNDGAIAAAFHAAFGRTPTADERETCLKHWEKMTARHAGLNLAKPKRPTEVVREAVEENTGVSFRYTEPLDAAADFVPDPHPADADARTRGLMEVCLVLFNANEFAYLD
jgi:mono/diheme cytochrome c family protein